MRCKFGKINVFRKKRRLSPPIGLTIQPKMPAGIRYGHGLHGRNYVGAWRCGNPQTNSENRRESDESSSK